MVGRRYVFSEVDKFLDLESELRIRGYSDIWKMRTGNAIDGCAIFWRTSRCWVKISMKMDCLSQQVIETIGIQIMRCLLQLDLSGVDRDKVSGQASAQIRSWKPYNPNPGVQPAGGSIQGPPVVGEGEVGVKLSDPLSDMQKNKEYGDAENVPFLNSSSPSQSNDALPNLNNKACSNMQCMNESTVSDVAANETEQMVIDGFKERSSCLHSEGQFPSDKHHSNDGICKLSHSRASHLEDKSDLTEMGTNASSHSNHGSSSEHSESNIIIESDGSCDYS